MKEFVSLLKKTTNACIVPLQRQSSILFTEHVSHTTLVGRLQLLDKHFPKTVRVGDEVNLYQLIFRHYKILSEL